jgi:hypothetical protein
LVPIKTPLVNNSIYNDFLNVRNLVGQNLHPHTLDLENYFVQCYRDIADGIAGYKIDMSREMTAWNAALQDQKPNIQAAVKKAISPIMKDMRIGLRRAAYYKMRSRSISFGKRLGLGKLKALIKPKDESNEQTGFPNILAAVEWDEMQNDT